MRISDWSSDVCSSDLEGFLREWLAGDVAVPGVKAKLQEWLDGEGGLRAWDISRDAPYFGFEIPGHPGKFLYVWLDAPIGYLSSFQALCERNGADFFERSDERRVGKECVRTWSSRWSPYNSKKKKK